MNDLSRQRCFNHAWREAVALCVECGRYYCRECVIEHDDRMVCASCLNKVAAARAKRKARLALFSRACVFFFGFLTIWIFFYLLGRGLLALPSEFHEGDLWRRSYWDSALDDSGE
jgi:hypothetical protein